MRIENIRRASLALLASLMLAGCMNGANTVTTNNQTKPVSLSKTNENLPKEVKVVDGDGELLGEIPMGSSSAVPGGILYSIFEPSETQKTPPAEYRYFNMETKEDIYLGTVENQGYEAYFSRMVKDGKVYSLAVTGDPLGEKTVPLSLLSFDLKNGSMKQITVSEDGYLYASMEEVGDKLVILNHEALSDPKTASLYEFDPTTETMKQVLVFSDSHESFRGISAAKDGFYLLRVSVPEDGKLELFLDRYDINYQKVSERSVTEALVQATLQVTGITGRDDALRELGMNVSKFEILEDRYLMYENFGLTRLVIDLEDDSSLMVKEDLWSASVGNGTPYFYELDFDPDDSSAPEIITFVNGKEETLSFTPSDSKEMLRVVSIAPDSPKLFMTRKGESNEDAERRIYLVK